MAGGRGRQGQDSRHWFAAGLIGMALLGACTIERASPAVDVPGGDPARGRQLIGAYGCGACHAVPGVTGARAQVGPPLTNWAQRVYIAGSLPNTPESLIPWLVDPQAVEPGTAMPNVGLTEQQARDIAAYLYTIR